MEMDRRVCAGSCTDDGDLLFFGDTGRGIDVYE